MKDYAKIKALAQSILECIGDEPEGENPSLPKQDRSKNDGGQESLDDMEPEADCGDCDMDDEKKKKKSKDSAIALMASTLSSRFNKK